MTSEQRETLEKLALRYVNGPHAILTHAEYTALCAALAPPPTCGMCSNWMTNHGSGWDKRHPCHFYGGVPRTADDGCIKGYTPKGDVR